jgi:hypothetical protein
MVTPCLRVLGALGVCFNLKLFVFVVLTWSLQTSRNKMMIEKLFSHSSNVLYKILASLHKWHILLKAVDQRQVKQMMKVKFRMASI